MTSSLAMNRGSTGAGGGNGFPIYAAISGAMAWGISAYRAATTGITYDEAYTYLHYTQAPTGFLQIDVANNHPLNSLLIQLATAISGRPFDEIVIRAPQLLAFAVYLFLAYGLAKRTRLPFLAFSLLALNYYLGEFFGLGRGYGLAATAVLAALAVYAAEPTSEKRILIALLLLCLASTAIYTCLALVAALAIHALLVDVGLTQAREFLRRNALGICEILVICSALGYAALIVAAPGRPAPAGSSEGASLMTAIPLGYAAMFTNLQWARILLAGLLVAALLGGAIASLRDVREWPFTWMALVTFALLITAAAVLGRQLEAPRLLLPFYPLVVIAVCESLARFGAFLSARIGRQAAPILMGVLSLLILGNYVSRIQLSYTSEWQDDYPLRNLMYQTAIDHEPRPAIDAAVKAGNPVVEFYARQIRQRDPGYLVPLTAP